MESRDLYSSLVILIVKVNQLDFFIYYNSNEGFILQLLKLGVTVPLFFAFQPKLAVLNQLSLSFQRVFSLSKSLLAGYLVVILGDAFLRSLSFLRGFQNVFLQFLSRVGPFFYFFKLQGGQVLFFCSFLIDNFLLIQLFSFFKELSQQANRGWSSILIFPSLNNGQSRVNKDYFLDMVRRAAILRFELNTALSSFILSMWNMAILSSKQCYLQQVSNWLILLSRSFFKIYSSSKSSLLREFQVFSVMAGSYHSYL